VFAWGPGGVNTARGIYEEPSPQNGTITDFDEEAGTFTYFPNAGFQGLEVLEYKFSEPAIGTDTNGVWPYYEDVQYVDSNTAYVFIEVGAAVDANLIVDGLSEDEEDQNESVLLALNDDDDNANTREDVDELRGPIANEDDLVMVELATWLRTDAHDEDFLATLSTSGGIRIWASEGKGEQIIPGTQWEPNEIPERVYVEGISAGLASLTLSISGPWTALYEGMVTPNFYTYYDPPYVWPAHASTSAQDTVQFNVGGPNLTAYRPMQGPNNYAPFSRTAVAEADEESETLGPGIRLNTDHDNGDQQVQDRQLIGSTIPNENDLIEINVVGSPGMNNLVLEVPEELALYLYHSKGTIIEVDEQTRRTAPFNYDVYGGGTKLFVEWASVDHGTADLKFIDADTETVLDTLTFHTFEGIVVGLSGQDWAGAVNIFENGMLDVSKELYKRGFDVRYYNQDQVQVYPVGSGPVYDEIVHSINEQGVEHVGLFGHSHGGGAVFGLARRLANQGDVGSYQLDVTAYVDAILKGSGGSERRLPVATEHHVNFYQTRRNPPVNGHKTDRESDYSPVESPIGYDVNEQLGWTDPEGNPLDL
jgi:hypothetical protein